MMLKPFDLLCVLCVLSEILGFPNAPAHLPSFLLRSRLFVGAKGFGERIKKPMSKSKVDHDTSDKTIQFYQHLANVGAADTVSKVGLAFVNDLRGVVSLRFIKKGETMIEIPFEAAYDLGVVSNNNNDPTNAAITLSDLLKKTKENDGDHSYFSMLPRQHSSEISTTTDYFSDDALSALQLPFVKSETVRRLEKLKESATSPDHYEELKLALSYVTSRVLTVEGPESEYGERHSLLIPMIDMCNHDRDSPHVLSGRAASGSKLRVVAGKDVLAGEQINICYGGGHAGNDRFVQDYGFLDPLPLSNLIVARSLVSRKIVEKGLSTSTKMEALAALKLTTVEEDELLLGELEGAKFSDDNTEEEADDSNRWLAISLRLGVKRALGDLGVEW